jgi:hypothetical protein
MSAYLYRNSEKMRHTIQVSLSQCHTQRRGNVNLPSDRNVEIRTSWIQNYGSQEINILALKSNTKSTFFVVSEKKQVTM